MMAACKPAARAGVSEQWSGLSLHRETERTKVLTWSRGSAIGSGQPNPHLLSLASSVGEVGDG